MTESFRFVFPDTCAMIQYMEPLKKNGIFADFFLDGAKILFGSLVVGAFVPATSGGNPSWLTVGIGVLWIVAFFVIASMARKRE